MILSRYTLKNIESPDVDVPDESIFDLPERVLQFGTGVLLRGLPDYFIDKANRQGIFNGRIVVVKSTSNGPADAFEKQDGLYTLCVRGLEKGVKKEENIINASISRVLNAHSEWKQILECAHNQNLQVIISNTTEVGIQLINDDIRRHPPVSFPGKLLAFLYERFLAFNGSARSGMVIVPTELITDNGRKLESIVLELAHLNGLEEEFIEWLENYNHFCNSLVDRIVPGKPDNETVSAIQRKLGYKDDLITVSEVYRLWAIEGDEEIQQVLSFHKADEGVIISPDIGLYRELKLRLLNGTHTLSCGLSYLAGANTVKEAMDDAVISRFIAGLMREEVIPSIPFEVSASVAGEFAAETLNRFANPHLQHYWTSISVQYSSKMKLRCIPLLMKHYEKLQSPPELFTLGFAAFLYFMKPSSHRNNQYYGSRQGVEYLIHDDQAEWICNAWLTGEPVAVVNAIFKNAGFWGEELSSLPGFANAVREKLEWMLEQPLRQVIELTLSGKPVSYNV